MAPVVMGAFLWLLADIFVGFFGEILLEMTRILNEDKHATPVAIGWFVVMGGVLGVVSAAAVDWRVGPEGAFLGISLLVTPMAMGGLAHFGGWLRARRHQISHLATWYGGASLGLGLAAGRFGALRMMGQL